MPDTGFWPFNGEQNADVGESSVLQKQLGDMEGEVKEIQMELEAIRQNRLSLCNKKQPNFYSVENGLVEKDIVPYIPSDTVRSQKLNKYSELTTLREELMRAKHAVDEERYQREKYEQKLKDVEHKLNNICGVGMDLKDPRKLEEENSSLKSQVRELKDEIEEIKLTSAENAEQLQEYRVKYMQAQQEMMEFKRQLDVADFDNKQVSDQVHLEIQKMKMQFQEKLQELSPLPDLLKGAQIQLQEAKQLQGLAEENSQQLSCELERVKEKVYENGRLRGKKEDYLQKEMKSHQKHKMYKNVKSRNEILSPKKGLIAAVNALNIEKGDKVKVLEEYQNLSIANSEKQKEINIMNKEIDDYRCKVLRLEEKLTQQELRFSDKANDCAQVHKELDELRSETSRTLARSKERADSMRRYLQTQVSELERQLIQSRAQFKACQKERDEIRQRMQLQVNSLQENFELAEIRLRNLQRKLTSLNNSYTVILADDDEVSTCKIVSP